MGHEFAPDMEFCIHCGSARQDVVEKRLECIDVEDRPKVIAISNIIARRNFAVILEAVEKINRMMDGDPPPPAS